MAMTLAEAAKLSNNLLLQGVIETIIYDSPVLQVLPFAEIVGNGLTYNQENEAPTIAFYDVGDTWAESTPTFTQLTANLKIMGGDADVDNFLAATRSNINDLKAVVIALKAKALQQKFDNTFINGDETTNPKEFDGLDELCTSGQTLSLGANGAALTLDKLDELVDMVKGGSPHMLLMSKRSRRKIVSLARAAGTNLQISEGRLGQQVELWGTIPIGVSDWIADDQTQGTSSDCSRIYALQFGEGAVAGLTSPGGLTVDEVGPLETKDADRTRVKMYTSLCLFNSLKLAMMTGITAA